MMGQKIGSIGTEENICSNFNIADNCQFLFGHMVFQSQIVMIQINQNTKMILKCVIHREMVKIGGRWWFSMVATVSPPFFTIPRCFFSFYFIPNENLGTLL